MAKVLVEDKNSDTGCNQKICGLVKVQDGLKYQKNGEQNVDIPK